jgi:hypothetical protein
MGMIILQRNNIEILKHIDLDGRHVYTVRELNGDDCFIDEFYTLDDAIEFIAVMPNGFDLRAEKLKAKSDNPTILEVGLIILIGCGMGMMFINWLGLL